MGRPGERRTPITPELPAATGQFLEEVPHTCRFPKGDRTGQGHAALAISGVDSNSSVGIVLDWVHDWGGMLTAALVGIVVVYLCWLGSLQFGWPGHEHTELVGDTLTWLLSAVAAGLAWRAGGSRTLDPRNCRAWRIVALAYGSLSLGDLLWLYFRAVLDIQPYPSLADIGYLGLYPLLLWGLLTFPSAPTTRAERAKIWLDTSMVVLSAASLFWQFVFRPVALGDHSDLFATSLSLAYPVCDLVLVFGVATLLLRRPFGGSRGALACLAAGLFFNAAANLVYGYELTAGTFVSGGWPDALWSVATLLIACSGQIQVWQARRGLAAPVAARVSARLNLAHIWPLQWAMDCWYSWLGTSSTTCSVVP